MGSTKRIQYEQRIIDLANTYKALGHPARVKILELLLSHQKLNGTNLSKEVKLSGPTISHHIRELYVNGLIGYEAQGKDCFYIVNPESLEFVTIHLRQLNYDSQNQKTSFDSVYFLPNFQLS